MRAWQRGSLVVWGEGRLGGGVVGVVGEHVGLHLVSDQSGSPYSKKY